MRATSSRPAPRSPDEEENTGNVLGTYTFAEDQYVDPSDLQSIAALTVRRRSRPACRRSIPAVNITNPSYPDPYAGRDPLEFVVSAPANITVRT